jgi:hypothetical protein
MDADRPSLFFAPDCSVCGKRVVTLEVVPPGEMPHEWEDWDAQSRRIFRGRPWAAEYTVLYRGVEAGSGASGTPSSEREARGIVESIVPELRIDALHRRFYDDLGYCPECAAFYCARHWSPSSTGYGRCPKGHGKGLDPHWSPEVLRPSAR